MAFKLCDNILVWNSSNLTLPNWVTSESVETCQRISNLKFIISYSNILLTKFRGGPLITKMVDNMMTKAKSFRENKPGYKMIGFFAHDNTIAAFLSHLGTFNQVKPPLASTVIVELYYDSQSHIIDNDPLSQFFVRLLFRNETHSNPYNLELSICKDGINPTNGDCRLDVLQRSLKPISVKNFHSECKMIENVEYLFISSESVKSKDESLTMMNEDELRYLSSEPSKELQSWEIIIVLFLLIIIFVMVFVRMFKKQ